MNLDFEYVICRQRLPFFAALSARLSFLVYPLPQLTVMGDGDNIRVSVLAILATEQRAANPADPENWSAIVKEVQEHDASQLTVPFASPTADDQVPANRRQRRLRSLRRTNFFT